MRYDAQKMADLKADESRIREEIGVIAQRMHDRNEGGEGEWTPEKTSQHERDAVDHGVATRNLQLVQGDIAAMSRNRPLTQREMVAPLQRFLAGGYRALGEDRKQFEVPDFVRQGSAIPDSGGELFYVPPRGPERAAALGLEHRMDVATDGTQGGQIAPTGILPPVDTLAFIGGALDAFMRFSTPTGGPLDVPRFDTDAQVGRIGTQQAPTNAGQGQAQVNNIPDPSNAQFLAWTANSDFIDLPMEATVDAGFDLIGFAFRQAERRLARAWNNAVTVNAGNGKPNGVILSASSITRVAGTYAAARGFAGLGTNVGAAYDKLVDIAYGVNRAYRDPMGEGVGAGFRLNGQGMIGWMISDGFERDVRKLRDGDGRPLWMPSIREGVPATLLGHPLIVNGAMADPAAAARPVAFGNWASIGLREVGGTAMYRFFDSGTAANNTTRVIGYNRKDVKIRVPGTTNPAVVTQQLGT